MTVNPIELLKKFSEKYRRTLYMPSEFCRENIKRKKYATSLEACYLFYHEFGLGKCVFVCHGMFHGKIFGKWYVKVDDYFIDPFDLCVRIDVEKNIYDEKKIATWIRRKIVFVGELNDNIVENIKEHYKKWFVKWAEIPEEYKRFWEERYLEIVDFYVKNRLNFPKYINVDEKLDKNMYAAGRFNAYIPKNLSEDEFVEIMKNVGILLTSRENVFKEEIVFWLEGL